MHPRLVDHLGVHDGLDPELRKAVVPFFTLYDRIWSSRFAWGEDERWGGLRSHLEWWARHPRGRDVWAQVRGYGGWSDGFSDEVDRVLLERREDTGYPVPAPSAAAGSPSGG